MTAGSLLAVSVTSAASSAALIAADASAVGLTDMGMASAVGVAHGVS